jgi:hypothetical protein
MILKIGEIARFEDNTLKMWIPITLINKLNQDRGRTFAEKYMITGNETDRLIEQNAEPRIKSPQLQPREL